MIDVAVPPVAVVTSLLAKALKGNNIQQFIFNDMDATVY
jgi:hypothetical protein